jgi:putative lipoprotein
MRRFVALILSLLLAACASGPNPDGDPTARVTGTVTYPQRIALPPTAVVTVRLIDASRADAQAEVLGEHVFSASGRQVPLPFSIAYDPSRISARGSYAVQARIDDDGKLRFISDQRYPVLTGGAPVPVEVVVRPVGGP